MEDSKNMKKIYIAMSADVIHQGHINIINEGKNNDKIYSGKTVL